jgi:1-acyl-sn-glycerol-3-phosphate acyltransferase
VSVLITILSYGTGAVFILLTFPVALLLRVLTFPFDRHRLLVGWSLVWLGRLFIRTSPLWEVTVEGTLPAPPSTYVVVPNHQSLVDALAVACLPANLKWIGKRSAFQLPWLGWAFSLAGYVPVLRGEKADGRRALARLRRYLAEGIPVGLFAEGTRSRDGQLKDFKAGPFKLAIEAGVPVIPVAISGAGAAMPADQAWIRPSRITVRILEPIPTRGMSVDDVEPLRAAVRRRLLDAVETTSASGRPGRGEVGEGPMA